MRDYAKKSPQSFRSSPSFVPSRETAQALGPESQNREEIFSDPASSKNNLIKYAVILLVILFAGSLLAQMIYKHHQAQTNPAQANSTQTNPNNNQAHNPPAKPAFDFYNSLSNPSSNQSINNPANNPANNLKNNHAPVISLPQSPSKIIQAPAVLNLANNSQNTQYQNTQYQNAQPPTAQTQNFNNPNNTSPSSSNLSSSNLSSSNLSNPNSTQPTNTSTQYILQVGAYRNKNEARSMQARLLLLGLQPSMTGTDSGWYRINLGPYSSKNLAESAKHKLQGARINGAVIKPKN